MIQKLEKKPLKMNCHLELRLLVRKWDLFALDDELLSTNDTLKTLFICYQLSLKLLKKEFFKNCIVKNIQVIQEETEFANLLKKDFTGLEQIMMWVDGVNRVIIVPEVNLVLHSLSLHYNNLQLVGLQIKQAQIL